MTQFSKSLFEFELSLTRAQKDLLNRLLVGPEFILELLNKEKDIPNNNSEIRLFLLKNKTQLYPYICGYLHNNVDVLINIVRKIIKYKDKALRLDFISNCSISKDNKIYFPINKLGLVEPANANRFNHWIRETKYKSYDESFVIIKRNNHFYVHIELIGLKIKKKKVTAKRKSTKQTKITPKQKIFVYKNGILCEHTVSPSKKRVDNAIHRAVPVKRRKSDIDYGQSSSGSVWTVSGGLPGLGKRR